MSVTRSKLAEGFHRLGLRPGDAVVVHSSLRSLGHVEGGAESVIDALLDVIEPQGLLVLPTFTYSSQVFDPARTPSLTGRITEMGRLWPGAVRSWHPTHSVAAIGAGASELCAGHHRVGCFALDSPLDRLAARGGYVLLLGVGHVSNSTVHVGESHARAPYLGVPFSPDRPNQFTIIAPTGELAVSMTEFPGCSKAFGVAEKVLRDRGQIRDAIVGEALTQLVLGAAVIEATVAILQANPAGVLCSDSYCYRCTQARRRL